MFSKKKKIMILTIMVALLVVTGYLNIALNNNVTQPTSTTATMDFYDSYRAERESSRESSILYYEGIIADSTSSQEAKEIAETKRQELIEALETELVVEGLIKGLGFEDVVLTSTSDKLNIVIKASVEDLTATQRAQILQIIKEQTNNTADDVRIIPSN